MFKYYCIYCRYKLRISFANLVVMTMYIFFFKFEWIRVAAFIHRAPLTMGFVFAIGRGQAHSEMQLLQHCARGLNRSWKQQVFRLGWVGFQKLVTCVCNQVVHSKDLRPGVNGHVIYISYTSLQSQSFKQKIQIH